MESDQHRFAAQLKILEQSGFTNERKNLKLLERTDGNVDVIFNFYNAQKALKEVLKAEKKTIEETKETLKGLKNLHFGEKDKKKESKDAKKAEKKDFKDAKKLEKKQFKEEQKAEKKRLKEEEKDAKNEEKRIRKEEKKIARATEDVPLTSLPENIKTVWLDGNNMLFVTSVIRNACLKSKLRNGEKMLESMARSWTTSCNQIARCTLIFDDTPTRITEERFDVLSARPNYATSDDALVDWATKTMEEKSSIAVFTSDRALSELLKNAGVTVFKSKKWYQLAMNAMPLGGSDSVDSWADQWIAKNHL